MSLSFTLFVLFLCFFGCHMQHADYQNMAHNFQKVSVTQKKHSHVISKFKSNIKSTQVSADYESDGVLRASSYLRKQHTEQQVLFLHFHKAGGTSICRYFKDSGTWRVPEKFCICNEKATTQALFAHTRKFIRMRTLDKLFQRSEADICMLEKKWMQPVYFFQIRQIFGGSFVTTLRVPWDRFRSNYEKDYSLCSDQYNNRNGYNSSNKMSIEAYSKLNPRDCLKSYYLRTNTNRPNFYVRMLNGLSVEQYSFDGNGDGGLSIMTHRHLEQAKEVLLAFDVVLFLEEDPRIRNLKLQKLTGSDLNLTQRSNNPFSEAHNKITNKTTFVNMAKRREVLDRDILPPTAFYETQFNIENALDIQLYEWAFRRFSGTGGVQ